ncbi:MAG: RluA family pseudouridine synthase [Clostridia bacterium]|nr:RluA family pseudouridine synthase [Clostridia bacterium]
MEMKKFKVENDSSLEKFLQDKGFAFFAVKKMLKNKDLRINGKKVSTNIELFKDDEVVCFSQSEKKVREIEKFFEDENVIIALKYSGIESTGEDGMEGRLSAFAVHRLDRNTQGLNVFAKNIEAKTLLEKVFKDGLVKKKYVCEVIGDTKFKGTIERAYLFKDAKKSLVFISKEKKPKTVEILTRFKTIKHGSQTSLVECELITGKTHQIRAHLAFLGHPILGDSKYGEKKVNEKFHQVYQKLCCFELVFDKNLGGLIENLSGKSFTRYPEWLDSKWVENAK